MLWRRAFFPFDGLDVEQCLELIEERKAVDLADAA